MNERFHREIARALICWYQCAEICNELKKSLKADGTENYTKSQIYLDNYAVYREALTSLICTMNVYDVHESIPLDSFGVLASAIKDTAEKKSISDAKAEEIKVAAKTAMKFITENKQRLIKDAEWQ